LIFFLNIIYNKKKETLKMKLIIFSDTHNTHHNVILPEGDILIFAGDMSNNGSAYECGSFIEWFISQPHKHKVFIAGNHDYVFDSNSKYRSILLTYADVDNCYYLENETIEIEGISIYGSPFTPRYGDWAFMRYRGEEMGDVWKTIPNKVDIIITHTPIHGYQDLTYQNINAGCEALKERLETVDYKIHICGHIHEAYGYKMIDTKLLINASICNPNGIPNKPIVVDFNTLGSAQ
jgi:Icc-related predicted phosphoesterase